MLDFHSHLPSPKSICCTDIPYVMQGQSLMVCEGLLPDKWTEERQSKLLADITAKRDIHLGEVGLDRRFESLISMDTQIRILRDNLELGISKDRCISLHCVRATESMVKLLSTISYRPYSILWHGFTGSKETARQLFKLKVMISVGPRFKGSLKDLYEANSYIVPETDYVGAEESEHDKLLKAMYQRLSEELDMAMETLTSHTQQMLKTFRGF